MKKISLTRKLEWSAEKYTSFIYYIYNRCRSHGFELKQIRNWNRILTTKTTVMHGFKFLGLRALINNTVSSIVTIKLNKS